MPDPMATAELVSVVFTVLQERIVGHAFQQSATQVHSVEALAGSLGVGQDQNESGYLGYCDVGDTIGVAAQGQP